MRISATDWVEGGWDIRQSVELARGLKELGVDLVDCSSGGTLPHADIPVGPGYQTAFAEQIRRETGIMTGASLRSPERAPARLLEQLAGTGPGTKLAARVRAPLAMANTR